MWLTTKTNDVMRPTTSQTSTLTLLTLLVEVSAMRGEFVRVAILLGTIEVFALWNSEVSAFQGVWLYVSLWRYIRDRAKCPDYRGCLLFRGVYKAGFHCIDTAGCFVYAACRFIRNIIIY